MPFIAGDLGVAHRFNRDTACLFLAAFVLFLDVEPLFLVFWFVCLFLINSASLCKTCLFMTSTGGLVIQENACNMIKFLESSYLNITGTTGGRRVDVWGQS